MMQTASKNDKNGFTLIETMVAISVIAIGLISSLSIITTALFYVSNVQDRLVATNLASEGIEIARNIRDSNWLQSLSWNSGLADGDYQAAYDSTSLSSYSGSSLLFDSASGLYSYNPGAATLYIRKISITNLSSYEIRVVSAVTWQKRGITYNSSVEDHLFNWQ